MDQLLPALLLTAAKRKCKFNRRLEITHAETESKFKKKVSALKSSYKKNNKKLQEKQSS